MPILRPLLQLVRLDSSLLGFLAIFLPLAVRTGDVRLSLDRALPLLFICMCTFIANDLNDVETDRINHPQRPLPSREITPIVAVILYFISLGLALFSARYLLEEKIAFWYYGLFFLSISYGYIVDHLPVMKAPFVAITSAIPVLIVTAWFPQNRLYFVCGSVFLITLGREICMGIKDRAGDADSVLNRVNGTSLARAAFSLQSIGLVLLLTQIEGALDALALLIMAGLLATSMIVWQVSARYRLSIILMKLQFFAGLYFLCAPIT